VFNDCNLQDAANKVQLIKDVFGTMKFSSNEAQFEVTFSAGVVDLNAFENVMPAIEAADKALYKAKSDGRNKVIKYKLSDIK
jgi:diguanylate cyclase (GGDEF)-like protein